MGKMSHKLLGRVHKVIHLASIWICKVLVISTPASSCSPPTSHENRCHGTSSIFLGALAAKKLPDLLLSYHNELISGAH